MRLLSLTVGTRCKSRVLDDAYLNSFPLNRDIQLTKSIFPSLLASYYWLTQMGAALFPGTVLIDPEFAKPGQLPIQLIVDVVMLTILGLGI